ncbi:MAG TPA: hypothetical protein VH062_00550 [Polyangiaceae bacterium]|jgi:hypothetical protein|nr:hypothetical protein [Polyangiaceae bacterium]
MPPKEINPVEQLLLQAAVKTPSSWMTDLFYMSQQSVRSWNPCPILSTVRGASLAGSRLPAECTDAASSDAAQISWGDVTTSIPDTLTWASFARSGRQQSTLWGSLASHEWFDPEAILAYADSVQRSAVHQRVEVVQGRDVRREIGDIRAMIPTSPSGWNSLRQKTDDLDARVALLPTTLQSFQGGGNVGVFLGFANPNVLGSIIGGSHGWESALNARFDAVGQALGDQTSGGSGPISELLNLLETSLHEVPNLVAAPVTPNLVAPPVTPDLVPSPTAQGG